MNHSTYRLDQVAREYNGRTVLQVDALHIEPGEVFALIGPSGAGKSTLLRLLNFLEPPSRGRIIFEDVEVDAAREAPLEVRRRVTTVFQRPMLLDMSVLENVMYGLRLRGQRDCRDPAQAVLDKVGLAHLGNEPARTLSGGEAQRVALARAIILQPDVLLLDEPTANLDPYNVGQIEEIAARLNHEQGTTLVLVTHNVFQAKRLADRAALMLEGKLVEVAETETFFQSPQDPRTAAFVRGDMVY
jgi:tungstate transport system ATP-binding protein